MFQNADRDYPRSSIRPQDLATKLCALPLLWALGLAQCAPIPAAHRGPGSLVIAVTMSGTLPQLRTAIYEGVAFILDKDPRAANSGAWRAEVIPGDVPTLQIVWTP